MLGALPGWPILAIFLSAMLMVVALCASAAAPGSRPPKRQHFSWRYDDGDNWR